VLSLAAWRPGAFAPRTAESLAPFADAAAVLLRSAAQREALLDKVAHLEHATGEGLAEALHELKAPLHSAAGFLELVATEQTGPLNEQQKDFLNTARGECARLKAALVALLEVGAASAQRPLELQVVQPTDLVDASVERMRGQAAGRMIRLIAESDPKAQSVRAHKPAILQVFANFLQNALRIAPNDSEIVVAASAAGGETLFTVADRGPGLAEYELESIFERFSQGRLGKREVGQLGLGLSISRRIVEQHRGRIWAENREDGGARFCFALPTAA
jgi:signal transduction histidine kinase